MILANDFKIEIMSKYNLLIETLDEESIEDLILDSCPDKVTHESGQIGENTNNFLISSSEKEEIMKNIDNYI